MAYDPTIPVGTPPPGLTNPVWNPIYGNWTSGQADDPWAGNEAGKAAFEAKRLAATGSFDQNYYNSFAAQNANAAPQAQNHQNAGAPPAQPGASAPQPNAQQNAMAGLNPAATDYINSLFGTTTNAATNTATPMGKGNGKGSSATWQPNQYASQATGNATPTWFGSASGMPQSSGYMNPMSKGGGMGAPQPAPSSSGKGGAMQMQPQMGMGK